MPQYPVDQLARTLLDCLVVTLAEADAPACTSFLSPSPMPPWDNCCLCKNGDGQLTVSLVNGVAVNPFNSVPCGREFTFNYRIQLTRCTPTVGESGTAPTPAKIEEAALKMYRDRSLILKAIDCCWVELWDFSPGDWSATQMTVLEPRGGCQVLQYDVAVRSASCSTCEDEE